MGEGRKIGESGRGRARRDETNQEAKRLEEGDEEESGLTKKKTT